MTNKQLKIVMILMQGILVGTLFLPAGRAIGVNGEPGVAVSVFGMIRRYAGMGFSNDALVYMVLSCLVPSLTVAACLGTLYVLATSCFFSAAKRKMVDSVTMTGLHYLIVFLALASMLLSCWQFLSTPPGGNDGEQ
mgnify:CR=1 FL=1